MEIKEHNKKCAEALGWTHHRVQGSEWWNTETKTHYVLFFHDSYDWAMLLVAKVLEDVEMTAKLLNKYLWDLGRFLTLTPQQISQSCLEVLD